MAQGMHHELALVRKIASNKTGYTSTMKELSRCDAASTSCLLWAMQFSRDLRCSIHDEIHQQVKYSVAS
jgi:hypothetical protein